MTTTVVLAKGTHPRPATDCTDPQRCLFEWYNWQTRHVHTDECPPGVSPVLHIFGMRLNDALPDGKRQQLAVYVPNGTSPLAGTAGDGLDERRSFLALDWLIRVYMTGFLDLVPSLAGHVTAVRDLAPVTDLAPAHLAGPVVDAAWAAAWAAARAAAGAAAGAAAWAAAWDAARAAAGAAARAAAGDAAGDAARAAAWAAAGAAAWAAARAAAGAAAGAAARAAAWAVLQPTVDSLQDSAIPLYQAMVNPPESVA